MRILSFAKRNFLEIIRDPLCTVFALLLPLILLIVFQHIKIPSEVYNIDNFAPGIVVFGHSFITLFTASLVAKDRSTSLLTRLCASPMKTADYLLGYIISILPIVLIQNIVFFAAAVLLGLNFSINIFLAIISSLPISVLFISLGILIGCVTSEKASGGVSSIIVQLVAFTSGMYFSSDMLGKGFDIVCKILPFSSCVDITKGILNGDFTELFIPCIIVCAYLIVICTGSSLLFVKKLKS